MEVYNKDLARQISEIEAWEKETRQKESEFEERKRKFQARKKKTKEAQGRLEEGQKEVEGLKLKLTEGRYYFCRKLEILSSVLFYFYGFLFLSSFFF
jgi:hypothetical protein